VKKKTTLVKAVKDNSVELVEELLREGADLEVLGMWDNTPLIIACTYGYSPIALRLIEQRANVHAKNELGASCLHYAAVEGMLDVVDKLLEVVTSEGVAGDTVKFVNCGDAKVYNRYLDAYSQRTPLASASESNFTEVVTRLLSAGARIEDVAADDGRTPLWLACRHSKLDAVRVLLQKGADVNTKDAQGVSALVAATIDPRATCIEEIVLALLASSPADVNDSAGSPLLGAVKAGKRGAAEALITNGALVQLIDKEGNSAWPSTPLHEACVKPDEYLVSLLVRARADPSLKNAAGLTAFDLLRKRQLTDGKIVSLLSAPPESGAADGSTGGAGSALEPVKADQN
jgi:ankyrin repeat protein